jgi:hypothetical protein
MSFTKVESRGLDAGHVGVMTAPPPKPAKLRNGFSFLYQLLNIVITSHQPA